MRVWQIMLNLEFCCFKSAVYDVHIVFMLELELKSTLNEK